MSGVDFVSEKRHQPHAPGHGLTSPTVTDFANALAIDGPFKILADHMPTLSCMANPDGYVFWYNQRWLDFCGVTTEAVAGDKWPVMHRPDTRDAVIARWQASLATGDPFEMTLQLRRADGLFFPFLTRIVPLRDDGGVITRWLCSSFDISAQIVVAQELHDLNAKYQAIAAEREALLAQLGESVIVADPQGRVTFMNEAAKRLHGVSTIGVTAENYAPTYGLLTLAGDPHPVETLPMTRAVRNLETVTNAAWRIHRPDGSEVYASGNARPFYGLDGALIGAVLSIRDETDRHAADMALAEVARLKELLLHEVNHRVKNNLQLIASMLSLQAGKTCSADTKRSLADAISRISVVSAIHHRLYSMGEHDRVDVSDYLKTLAVDTVRALDDQNHVDIEFDGPFEVSLTVDKAIPLALIVSELLTNAVKYAFTGMTHGTVRLSVVVAGSDLVVTLADDGRGLPTSFDPQHSASLGMRIVAALVGQLNGVLSIVRQDQGTCFEVRIPACI